MSTFKLSPILMGGFSEVFISSSPTSGDVNSLAAASGVSSQGSRCWELITHATTIWGNLTHCPDMFIHRLHSMVHLDNLQLGKSHKNHREISAFYKGYRPSNAHADKLSTPAKWGHKTVENINLTRKKLILKDTKPSLSQPYHSTPLTHPIFSTKLYGRTAPWFHLDHPTLNHMLLPILVVVVHQHPQSISRQVPLPNQPDDEYISDGNVSNLMNFQLVVQTTGIPWSTVSTNASPELQDDTKNDDKKAWW